jgi:hypothetical protein
MTVELEHILAGLGLQQYLTEFSRAGFGNWETLSSIVESDLVNLNIRLGHRRKLQREIARRYFWPDDKPLPTPEELQQHAQNVSHQTSLPRFAELAEESIPLTSSTRSPYSSGSSPWSSTPNGLEISFNSNDAHDIGTRIVEISRTANLPPNIEIVASPVSQLQ